MLVSEMPDSGIIRGRIVCAVQQLTTSEAAERLGVTRWRVNALIKAGRLKAENSKAGKKGNGKR